MEIVTSVFYTSNCNIEDTNFFVAKKRIKIKGGKQMKRQKRNYINSLSSNNYCTFNFSRSNYKFSNRTKWNSRKSKRCKRTNID